jgi:translocation and assembly module TamB
VLDGRAAIDLRLGGSLDAPSVAGDVSLTDGHYENLMLGTILTDLTVTSSVAEDGALRLDVSAEDGSGAPVRAEAEIAGDALTASVSTRNAILVRRDDAVAAITIDMGAEGDPSGLAVTGEITIERAEIRLVNATPPSVASLGDVRIKGAPEPEPEDPAGQTVTLDIAIRAPDEIFVRGRGLDSEWMINLDVSGTAAEPRIAGAIERRRGILNLAGARFDVERGEIRFIEQPVIDPTLDIAITREEEGVRGGIYVSGFASDPQIHFRSQPELPEGEVLPRVLFGKSRQGLSSSEALQLAAGLAVLLDGAGDFSLGSARSALGVDVLRFDTEGDSTALEIGSNIADGVYVGAKQPVDGGSTRVQVEVELFENFTADSEVGADSGTSFGLNWKKDF